MALVRMLEKRGVFRQMEEGEPSLENMCGSGAKHFKVSANGRISFYKDDVLPAARIAFGFALSRDRVDDVEFARLPRDLIEGIVTLVECPGETKLPDVNAEHLDAVDVSLARLGRLVIAGKTAGEHGSLNGDEVVELIVAQMDSGDLTEKQVGRKLLDEIKGTNAYKKAMLRKEQQF